jgi:3'-5' exoribonuclease
MWTELRGIVSAVHNPHLKALLDAMLDDEDVSRRYRRAPAAKQIHHAWLGGLIEHVLSLCALARLTASHYPQVDYDLLITGVVLHDIGKIYELNYERGFSYSNDGQLLGHISIGMRMVGDKLRDIPGFPPKLRTLVEHMILSHHGQLEFGSPKLPQFPEALLLHHLDDLDSKMECMRALVENDRQLEGCFTSFNNAMARSALKKERYLNGDAAPPKVRAAVQPGGGDSEPAVPANKPSVAPATVAAHPLFAPRPDSPFADKLKQALQSNGPKQES